MNSIETDVLIIGGGIVGLALAYETSKYNDCILIEKNKSLIEETSSRNSGVIHSGIYYPEDSFKSKFCIQGKKFLYDFCKKYNVPHEKTGKLLISDKDNLSTLQALKENADNLDIKYEIITKNRILSNYPFLCGEEFIDIKDSGIVDVHELATRLESLSWKNGAYISTQSNLIDVSESTNCLYESAVKTINETFEIKSKSIVFCTGLHTNSVIAKLNLNLEKYIKENFYLMGHYYKTNNWLNIRKLIYPIPEKNALGVHLSTAMNDPSTLILGPDATETFTIDYKKNAFSKELKEKFYCSIEKYMPEIRKVDISADYVGIRPKIHTEGFQDFEIIGSKTHKHKNLFILQGIDSPGLTSCLAIAKYINKNLDIK